MNAKERFNAIANFKSFDRLPIIEWANWWDKTIERWHTEKLPLSITDRYDISRHFDLDVYYHYWGPLWTPALPQPKSHGAGLIENEADYEKLLPCLYPIDRNILANKEYLARIGGLQRKEGSVFWFNLEGFFWFPRRLLGIERHLYSFYDQGELLHRINSDLVECHIRAIDAICEHCQPDFMTFSEDLSYNNGPMLSKAHFDEFLLPYYRKVISHLKERGIKVFVDSDGDVTEALYWFENAGFDGILPLERQAGCDIAELRKDHPKILFLGAFDKTVMHKGEAAIRAEFDRLLPVAKGGGYFLSCDHQTPPEVSYDDYLLYLRLFREYAAKAGGL